MSKVLYWIVALPLTAVVIVFSLNNRTEVVLDLWPLDAVAIPMPVFTIVLVSLVAGFLAGGLVAWNSAGRTRQRVRAEARRADRAERDLKSAQERINGLQKAVEVPDPPIAKLPSNAA